MAKSGSAPPIERPTIASQYEALEYVYSENLYVTGSPRTVQDPIRPYTGIWSVSRYIRSVLDDHAVGTGRDLMEAVRHFVRLEDGLRGRKVVSRLAGDGDPGDELL